MYTHISVFDTSRDTHTTYHRYHRSHISYIQCHLRCMIYRNVYIYIRCIYIYIYIYRIDRICIIYTYASYCPTYIIYHISYIRHTHTPYISHTAYIYISHTPYIVYHISHLIFIYMYNIMYRYSPYTASYLDLDTFSIQAPTNESCEYRRDTSMS